ncbi:MAG TPA: MFS transporter [Burkholderiales bacterium]|nr:MFS transporter [Burkholderiales bacterium]
MPPQKSATHQRQRADSDLLATLGAGLFTNGVWDMLSVIVPLYAVAVGLNAAEIGLIVAARSVLPAVLSIHGGILMDQLGTRRVLLWVAAGCTALPLLYPISGWFAVLGVLQLLLGLASALGMAASQTWAMQVGRGDTAILARYSVATRIGTFIGPVVVGAAWDHFGAWAAFACVAICGAGIIVATARSTGAEPPLPHGRGFAILLPQWEPHKQALLLALIPSVAFILAASFLRNSSGAIQSSLFVVYLNGIGLSGTLIGTLVAIAELSGVAGSLLAAPAERRLGAVKLVLLCIVVSLVCISATPLIAPFLIVLIAACVLRGIVQGMSQPLMYAILSNEVSSNRHGASVGLRNAVVRLGSIITPTVMGVAAEAYGIEMSFYIIGTIFLLITAGLAMMGRRLD